MTNAEIANQLRHKAADLHALADQLDPPVTETPAPPSSGTWTPATPEHAASLGFDDLVGLANLKQSMTGLAFTPASYFETVDEFVQHLIGFVTT